MTPWDYYKKEDLEEEIKTRLDEVIPQKTTDIINKWRTELNDDRKVAVKIIDNVLERKIGLSSSDLPDTATFTSGLDDIEVLLKDGNYEQAIRQAVDTAREMIEEEGGGELFESRETKNLHIFKNKQGKPFKACNKQCTNGFLADRALD